MPPTVPDGRPPLLGTLVPYRLYTVHYLPYDAVPSYMDGGPAKVVLEPWATTRVHPSSRADFQCSLKAYNPTTGERHPLDGTLYDSSEAADRAAYEAGLTAFFIPEDKAPHYGLAAAPLSAKRTPR